LQTVIASRLELDVLSYYFLNWSAFTDSLDVALRNSASCHRFNITVQHQIAVFLRQLSPPYFILNGYNCNNGAHGPTLLGFHVRKFSSPQEVFACRCWWDASRTRRRVFRYRS